MGAQPISSLLQVQSRFEVHQGQALQFQEAQARVTRAKVNGMMFVVMLVLYSTTCA